VPAKRLNGLEFIDAGGVSLGTVDWIINFYVSYHIDVIIVKAV